MHASRPTESFASSLKPSTRPCLRGTPHHSNSLERRGSRKLGAEDRSQESLWEPGRLPVLLGVQAVLFIQRDGSSREACGLQMGSLLLPGDGEWEGKVGCCVLHSVLRARWLLLVCLRVVDEMIAPEGNKYTLEAGRSWIGAYILRVFEKGKKKEDGDALRSFKNHPSINLNLVHLLVIPPGLVVIEVMPPRSITATSISDEPPGAQADLLQDGDVDREDLAKSNGTLAAAS
ncbi:hypothetical protein JHW43_006132 [Diplocarpon mali]|nr:hypothetical protein JHW43_006132 [Diplocarpon mali]